MKKSNCLSLACLVACLLIPSATSAQKVEPKVKIGKDTTYIDGPLTKDGYIDYVAHLNKILSKGVTSENNSAVLLLKASPGEISDEKFLKRYCKALGIAPIPLKGDYFQDYHRYSLTKAEKKKNGKLTDDEKSAIWNKLDKSYEKFMGGPWKRDEFPEVAKWIDSSEKHLELIRKATLRSRYYHPMLNGEGDEYGSVVAILLPQAQSTRGYARALVARAFMYLGEGEIDKCLDDLLTMRRLGNHVASGATIIEQLVGIAIVGMAQDAERKVAYSGKLDAEQLLEYRAKMSKHRMKSNMLRSFSECERLMYLDAVQHVMRGGITSLNQLVGMSDASGDNPQTKMRNMLDQVISNSTDWSVTMREGNRIYDKYENQLKTDDWLKQDEGVREMEKEIQEMAKSVSGTSVMVKAMLGGPEYRGKLMGKIFTSLLLPALNAATTAEKRVQIMDDLTYIALSLAAYQADNGNYPASLGDLKGEAGQNIPRDRYSEKPFVYRREGSGFVVYSIGPNRKDDQGNGVYNEKMSEGDDYGAGYETVERKVNSKPDLN